MNLIVVVEVSHVVIVVAKSIVRDLDLKAMIAEETKKRIIVEVMIVEEVDQEETETEKRKEVEIEAETDKETTEVKGKEKERGKEI